ncbi:uncharacterized protein [Lepeophtheirus salmonis]|uniref:uncharacterized protein n=1 Tax=Lepeophtheirus salmonis TaxID=72036 RepID=UPI001AE0F845|nr:uncharacterized protein LOC121127654 [Lepeophtheirus salmonis]
MKITFPGKDAEFTYNPFPTIAVWAAIRFIHRQKPDAKHNAFAFLPLISDPSDKEKNTLFHDLSIDELVYTQKNVYHPPLFACIMRQHGVSRKLECHGFVCDTKEDAISIAADLFKCLMSSVEIQTKKPKRRNSTVSSKSSSISVVSSRLRKNRSLRQSKRINNSIARRKLQEKESGIKGDIYTKVAMPRSRSFMNVNGQYNLQDLFKELRDKEGIESVDDVLRLVISPHGMSFNKIPPMYRDLLMKLVMSMSKDEIFIRSKNIMMEELKKSKKKKKGFLLGKRKKSTSIKAKDLDKELKKLTIGNPVPIDLDQIQKFPPSKAIDLNLIKKTQERSVFINAKPIQSSSNSSSSSTKKMSSTNNKLSLSNSRRISSGESEYKSCSECGYTSVCGTLCSCSSMEESSSLPSASRKSNSNPSSNCTCKDCDESLSIYCSSCTSVHSDDEEDDEKMSMDSVVDKDWSKKKLSSSSNASSSSSPGKSDELFVNSSTYTEFETEDSHGKTMSSDSLSSSSSSYSSSHCDSLSGEHPQKLHRKSDGSVIYKGPRPAYSESNMQNSLGYLP